MGLTADEIEAEEMAQKLAAPHVNFYDPALFQDLQAEVMFCTLFGRRS